jgi:FMN-dependent NADH-azoreductase
MQTRTPPSTFVTWATHLTRRWTSYARGTVYAGGQRSSNKRRVALDDALIAELQAADVVVLGVPMYNFGVSAQLKNWIDAISCRRHVQLRRQWTEGLLKARRSTWRWPRRQVPQHPADTQVPYLTTVLTFLGMDEFGSFTPRGSRWALSGHVGQARLDTSSSKTALP